MAPPALLGSLCSLLLLLLLLPLSSTTNAAGINDKYNNDLDVGTSSHVFRKRRGSITDASCQQSGTLSCRGKSYPTYRCSPPVTSATPAVLTNNDFSAGGDGGGPSECDGRYHSNSKHIVALSTGWYSGGSRCHRMIRITASNGRSTTAKVVDECDSMNGCDEEHAHQPPCPNNVVDASNAVWHALGLNIDDGVVPITWTMA
ncbi:hypothetical protein Taro_034158 [Colocasia esculenta]|uniref:Uncharacterized protein n=1 Tax=Colocasia esculenta TaxID=4460 RepID=A0A843WB45_COLES|nr:hypothetical protein [Colocasia esculenta]